jgi:hypothetical protein
MLGSSSLKGDQIENKELYTRIQSRFENILQYPKKRKVKEDFLQSNSQCSISILIKHITTQMTKVSDRKERERKVKMGDHLLKAA